MPSAAVTLLSALVLAAHCPLPRARNYDIVLERVDNELINKEYFGSKTAMRVRRASRKALPGLSDVLEIIKPLPNDTVIETMLFERHDNKYVPSWLKYRVGLCEYLAHEKRPIFSTLGKIYKFPPSCPMVGTYSVEDFRPDDRLLPPILPGPEHWKLGLYFRRGGGLDYLLRHDIVFRIDRSRELRGR